MQRSKGIIAHGWGSQEGQRATGGGDSRHPCPGCVAAIQRLPARVRGAAQGQEGDFPLGRRARKCARAPASVPARHARPIGRAGAEGERVAAQRRQLREKEERGRMTHGVHRSCKGKKIVQDGFAGSRCWADWWAGPLEHAG
jgi:hypothetical protein